MERPNQAQSARYRIRSEFDAVFLDGPGAHEVVIGEFYDDMACALIDAQERFCVLGGSGLIVYWLRAPFEPYAHQRSTPQWNELWRDPSDLRFIERIDQIDDEHVCVWVEKDESYMGYILNVETMKVQSPDDLLG